MTDNCLACKILNGKKVLEAFYCLTSEIAIKD